MDAIPRRLALAALCLATSSVACLDDLPSPALVDDLRVLAVRADPPEVVPGAAVALDALVVDPNGRVPTYAWYACVVVEQGQGFFGGGSETSTSGGNGTPLSDDPYGGSCERRVAAGERYAVALGNQPTATLQVPADFFADDYTLRTAYGLGDDVEISQEVKAGFLGIAGVNYTVSLVVEVDGRRIETQKRVNVSLPSDLPDNAPNLNPTALAFHAANAEDEGAAPTNAPAPADGTCLIDATVPFVAGERYRLTPVNIPDPQPKYVVLLAGTTTDAAFDLQTIEETTFYSWFMTRGALKKAISKAPGAPENTWTFEDDDAGQTDLWVVVRDGRGGVSWCHQNLLVGPR